MYFGSGRARLNNALKTLRAQWDNSADRWRDQVRLDFEREHVEPVLSQAERTLQAMDELVDLLGRIQRDCSSDS